MWVQNDIVNAIVLKEGNNKQKSFILIRIIFNLKTHFLFTFIWSINATSKPKHLFHFLHVGYVNTKLFKTKSSALRKTLTWFLWSNVLQASQVKWIYSAIFLKEYTKMAAF